jgi:hypothetical protein
LDKDTAPSFEEHREALWSTTKFWLDKTADGMLKRAKYKTGRWIPNVGDSVWLVKDLKQKKPIRTKAEKLSSHYFKTSYRIIEVTANNRYKLEAEDGSVLPFSTKDFHRPHIALKKLGENS